MPADRLDAYPMLCKESSRLTTYTFGDTHIRACGMCRGSVCFLAQGERCPNEIAGAKEGLHALERLYFTEPTIVEFGQDEPYVLALAMVEREMRVYIFKGADPPSSRLIIDWGHLVLAPPLYHGPDVDELAPTDRQIHLQEVSCEVIAEQDIFPDPGDLGFIYARVRAIVAERLGIPGLDSTVT